METLKIILSVIIYTMLCMGAYATDITYTVTRPDMGQTNSLDVILEDAISDANLGNNVTILFDVEGEGGVAQQVILADLLVINHTAGSITLDAAPDAPDGQGIQFDQNYVDDVNLKTGLSIQSTSTLIIQNLNFSDFIAGQYNIPRKVLVINSLADEVYILNNNFVDNFISISSSCYSNIQITGNTFSIVEDVGNTSSQLNLIYYGENTNTSISDINGNFFINNYNLQSSWAIPIVFYNKNLATINIENNIITNFICGVSSMYLNENNLRYPTSLVIKGNEINHSNTAIGLFNPYIYWRIEQNDISISNIAIAISGSISSGVYFINNGNALGLSPNNFGNTFSDITFNTFDISCSSDIHAHIIGYDLPAKIFAQNDNYVITSRGNKIVSNGVSDFPHAFYNTSIPVPELLNAYTVNGILSVQYNVDDQYDYDDYLDFYKTNTNGDLLEYIGNFHVTNSSNHVATVSVPGNVELSVGDRIAATITYDPHSDLIKFPGTSRAVYSVISSPCNPIAIINVPAKYCVNKPVLFDNQSTGVESGQTYYWDFGDNATSTEDSPVHTYTELGVYHVRLRIEEDGQLANGCIFAEKEITIEIVDCNYCDGCISKFSPEPGGKYVISGWAKESVENVQTYDGPAVYIEFPNTGVVSGPFKPSGVIIDGWQQFTGEFDVPQVASTIKLLLTNDGTNDVYFDDIRVHPFNSNMKSFVYDKRLFKVSAELDENNYATFYEYDDEGNLTRVKKETERGIYTIKEIRSNTSKTSE